MKWTPYQWTPYPRLPHIEFCTLPDGRMGVRNTTAKVFTIVDDGMDGVHQFAADNSEGPGDLVHNVAKRAGFKRCGKCAKRQALLNSMKFW